MNYLVIHDCSVEKLNDVKSFFKNFILYSGRRMSLSFSEYSGVKPVSVSGPVIYYVASDLMSEAARNAMRSVLIIRDDKRETFNGMIQAEIHFRGYPAPHPVNMPEGSIRDYPVSVCRPIVEDRNRTYIYITNDGNYIVNFDLFSLVFHLLSCGEEYKFNHKSFNSFYHNNPFFMNSGDPYQPTVTQLYKLFQLIINKTINNPGSLNSVYPRKKRFAVCLTHDVDGIRKNPVLTLKRMAIELPNLKRFLQSGHWRKGLGKINRMLRFCLSREDYMRIEEIAEIEKRFNAASTFFVYSKTPNQKLNLIDKIRKKAYDPAYDLSLELQLMEKLRTLIAGGFEVGLHGSIFSYEDEDILREEKRKLEYSLGHQVLSLRHHFLRFSFDRAYEILPLCNFFCSSTCSFNDYPGFRGHCANPYWGYNHSVKNFSDVMEFPMPIMDAVYFDFMNYDEQKAWQVIRSQLETARDLDACIAVNWHQRGFTNDFNWKGVYSKILEWVNSNDGHAGTVKSIYEHRTNIFKQCDI